MFAMQITSIHDTKNFMKSGIRKNPVRSWVKEGHFTKIKITNNKHMKNLHDSSLMNTN